MIRHSGETIRLHKRLARGLTLACGFGICGTAAWAGDKPWSLEASGGLRYDSNVVVEEVDQTVHKSAGAGLIDLSGKYEFGQKTDTSLKLGYSFSQLIYFDIGQLDRQTHGLSAHLKHNFGSFEAGLMYNYFYVLQGGGGFLNLHQASPYVSFRPLDDFYVRVAYVYTDLNLIKLPTRDATANHAQADVYYFIDGPDTFVHAGYEREMRNAVDPQFGYDANIFNAGLVTHVPLGEWNTKLTGDLQYESRDYDAITPSIGVKRNDKRSTFTGEWEIPFNDCWYTALEYRFRNSSSQLPSADYNQHRVDLRVGLRL